MKEKLLIVGAGGLGRVVLEQAEKDYECAFLDDGPQPGTIINGSEVIGGISKLHSCYPEYRHLVVAIGDNALREKVYREAEKAGYDFPNIVWPSVYISPYAKVGRGCILLNNVVIQNAAVVGDGTILCTGVEAHHESTIGNCCVIYTNSVVRSLTHVGDRVWIGSTVSISTRASVPDDAVIEDGSVVRP